MSLFLEKMGCLKVKFTNLIIYKLDPLF